jgi:apolipoprotein N-acyltransferase
VFGHELIPAVRQGATILANFSNLGWFGDSVALRQHWQMARFRAIETQRPVLRSTNTGMTGAINEFGQTIAILPAMVAGYLDVQIQGRTGLTPYVRWGDYPVLLLACVILILALLGRRRRQP